MCSLRGLCLGRRGGAGQKSSRVPSDHLGFLCLVPGCRRPHCSAAHTWVLPGGGTVPPCRSSRVGLTPGWAGSKKGRWEASLRPQPLSGQEHVLGKALHLEVRFELENCECVLHKPITRPGL